MILIPLFSRKRSTTQITMIFQPFVYAHVNRSTLHHEITKTAPNAFTCVCLGNQIERMFDHTSHKPFVSFGPYPFSQPVQMLVPLKKTLPAKGRIH